ncbi:hypothetical protein AVEN_78802-1 [Araneus ventricosus]|uniref:Uncharacterized protein n=1 Tax=Araneus ventricosus TaxID=182803 RepID=A0A4Y2HGP7_ARAVE|nr:hypothetical protein AVEN_78802-1 [Araneus ventricosus]
MDKNTNDELLRRPLAIGVLKWTKFSVKGPTRPTAFSPLSEQQPAEIRSTSIEVTWPVTAGSGVRGLK